MARDPRIADLRRGRRRLQPRRRADLGSGQGRRLQGHARAAARVRRQPRLQLAARRSQHHRPRHRHGDARPQAGRRDPVLRLHLAGDDADPRRADDAAVPLEQRVLVPDRHPRRDRRLSPRRRAVSLRSRARASSRTAPAFASRSRRTPRTPPGCCARRSAATIRCSSSSTSISTGRPTTRASIPAPTTCCRSASPPIRRDGDDVVVLTWGALVQRSLLAAQQAEKDGISVMVVDLRTIMPFDWDTISTAVAKHEPRRHRARGSADLRLRRRARRAHRRRAVPASRRAGAARRRARHAGALLPGSRRSHPAAVGDVLQGYQGHRRLLTAHAPVRFLAAAAVARHRRARRSCSRPQRRRGHRVETLRSVGGLPAHIAGRFNDLSICRQTERRDVPRLRSPLAHRVQRRLPTQPTAPTRDRARSAPSPDACCSRTPSTPRPDGTFVVADAPENRTRMQVFVSPAGRGWRGSRCPRLASRCSSTASRSPASGRSSPLGPLRLLQPARKRLADRRARTRRRVGPRLRRAARNRSRAGSCAASRAQQRPRRPQPRRGLLLRVRRRADRRSGSTTTRGALVFERHIEGVELDAYMRDRPTRVASPQDRSDGEFPIVRPVVRAAAADRERQRCGSRSTCRSPTSTTVAATRQRIVQFRGAGLLSRQQPLASRRPDRCSRRPAAIFSTSVADSRGSGADRRVRPTCRPGRDRGSDLRRTRSNCSPISRTVSSRRISARPTASVSSGRQRCRHPRGASPDAPATGGSTRPASAPASPPSGARRPDPRSIAATPRSLRDALDLRAKRLDSRGSRSPAVANEARPAGGPTGRAPACSRLRALPLLRGHEVRPDDQVWCKCERRERSRDARREGALGTPASTRSTRAR